ncbi:DTW domain containing 2 isoform X2 [Oratosquilla oratoria]
MLETALPKGHYITAKGKRFSSTKYPHLSDILKDPMSLLMYPGQHACSIEDLPPVSCSQSPYNIVIIDGTWQQAKSIYFNNPELRALKQVSLSGKYVSEYVIRTQPTEDALSTVETAAIALATLESNWSLYSSLVAPLQALCRHQLAHGAVPHQSKEQMILSGRYKKPLGKRTYKKLRKCGARSVDGTLSDFVDTLHLISGVDKDFFENVCKNGETPVYIENCDSTRRLESFENCNGYICQDVGKGDSNGIENNMVGKDIRNVESDQVSCDRTKEDCVEQEELNSAQESANDNFPTSSSVPKSDASSIDTALR